MARGSWLVARDLLFELDQHAVRAGGMDERHERTLGARSRRLVYQRRAALFQLRQRRVNVIDAQRDVVQSRTALVDESRDGGIGRSGLEQFETGFAHRDEVCAHALRSDLFWRLDLEAQRVPIERQRRRQIFHGNPDVIQDCLHVSDGPQQRQIFITKTRRPRRILVQSLIRVFRGFVRSRCR